MQVFAKSFSTKQSRVLQMVILSECSIGKYVLEPGVLEGVFNVVFLIKSLVLLIVICKCEITSLDYFITVISKFKLLL